MWSINKQIVRIWYKVHLLILAHIKSFPDVNHDAQVLDLSLHIDEQMVRWNRWLDGLDVQMVNYYQMLKV